MGTDITEVVARGQTAWECIKEAGPRGRGLSTGENDKAKERRARSQVEHRLLWLDVGAALTVGKRESGTDRDYYAWIEAHGFQDISRSARQDAVWLVANIETLGELPDGIASPGTIRQWAHTRDAAATYRAKEAVARLTRPLTASEVAALRKATALLREATQNNQCSEQALDDAAALVAHVRSALKSRNGT